MFHDDKDNKTYMTEVYGGEGCHSVFGISIFVTFSAILQLVRCRQWWKGGYLAKAPPNPKSLETSSYAEAGIQTWAVARQLTVSSKSQAIRPSRQALSCERQLAVTESVATH